MERKAKDYVEVIRTVAPKYDKQLHSKIQRPGLYGIRLTPAAEAAIVVAFGEPYNRSKVDKHKLKAKVQCRLTEYEIDRLQQQLRDVRFEALSISSELTGHSRQSQIEVLIEEQGIDLEGAKTPPYELEK